MDSFTSHNWPITSSEIPQKLWQPDKSSKSPFWKLTPPDDASLCAGCADPTLNTARRLHR